MGYLSDSENIKYAHESDKAKLLQTEILGARAMRFTLLFITALSITSCSEELRVSSNYARSNEPIVMLDPKNIRTYEELRSYLDRRYGEVEELPVAAIISSGMDTSVPYKFRLQGGREFTIPIIFTASNERIVGSEFDFGSLPN